MARLFRARRAGPLAFLAGLVLAAAPASATWSILLLDTRTGEIGVASATCLTTFDLQKWTPVLITGVGAATAQAAVGGTQFANRTYIRDRLILGAHPTIILSGLGTYDNAHASRQYGIVTASGLRSTFTGPLASQWRGGMSGAFDYTYQGQSGTIVFAIQGNILTGAPVVQDAVTAAMETDGDLPQRLMAAMEAARAAGGDGRCSCLSGPPTSCGAPPPSFEKSAHIGYMLVARAGDTDASHSYYRAGLGTADLVAADLTGDGLPDFATANAGDSSISFLLNLTAPDGRFPRFDVAAGTSVGAPANDIAIADITGDSIPDLVITTTVTNRVSVYPGLGGGACGVPVHTLLSSAPDSIAVGDFDGAAGPDVAVLTATSVSVLFNDGSGGLLPPVSLSTVPPQTRSLIAADVTGLGHLDLVAVTPVNSLVIYRGDGAGGFTVTDAPLPGPDARAVAAGDFDGDGDTDLAVVHAGPSPSLSILLNSGPTFTHATHPLPAAPNHVAVGDITGDGIPDLVIPAGGGRFLAFHGAPGGVFEPAGDFDLTTDFAGDGVARAALADVDGDGDLDAAFAVSTFGSVAIAENLGGGRFVDSAGTASGDYFMAFNVPNQPAEAPDPVVQLRSMFDEWRDALVGRPDAVQSLVGVPTLVAGSSRTGVMTITLRDRAGDPVTAPISSLTVEPVAGDPAHVTAGPVTSPAPGVYEVVMSASADAGSTRFVITADDGVRPVVLMPVAEVAAVPCPADQNADGAINSNDIAAFLQAWLASVLDGTPAGDFDEDGEVNSADISAFLTRWLAGVTSAC